MSKDVFKVTSSALPDSARVAGFRGTEGISRPYQFDVFVLLGVEGNDLDLADVVGAKMKLELDRDDGRPAFAWNGILCAFELLHEFGDRSLFHATLVPQLWQLSQTFHSFIWTNKSIPDILKEVLEDSGLSSSDYSLRLTGTYPPQEHVCQYQESNLDFISRWMEREGMYYFFEQGDDSEVLVITDSAAKHEALDPEPVRFFSLGGHDGSSGEALHTFTCKQHVLPATVKLADYDYAKPTLDVSGSAPVTKTGIGEISVYGHRFFTPDDGKRLAKLRAEELLARQAVYRGAGTEFHLRAGYFFTLENHPRATFDMKYLATDVTHTGNQTISSAELRALTGIDSDRVYWAEVKAIPGATQFRAVRTTPWPRIYGFENGIVGGAADSDYAQIDDQGRYNVKFKFDESGLGKDQASTWVRMLQPHGGNPEGFHFPLRNGTEVLFTFLGGDPDRPVITGVVPNAHNPSLVTNKNNTQNVLKTGGQNHMIIEDVAGKQSIDIFSPTQTTTIFMGGPRQYGFDQAPAAKSSACTITSVPSTLLLDTDGSGGLDVRGSWYVDIGTNYSKFVSGTAQIEYVGIHTLNCDADSNEWYNDHQNIVVATGRTDKVVAGGMTQDIHGGLTQTIEPGGSSTVTGGWTHEVSEQNKDKYDSWDTNVKDLWHADIGEVTWTIHKDVNIHCKKWECEQSDDVIWNMFANKSENTFGLTREFLLGLKSEILIGGKFELTIGSAKEIFVGKKVELSVGGLMDTKIAAQLEINIGPKTELKGVKLENEGEAASKAEAELKKCTAYVEQMSTMVTRAGTSVIIQAPNVTFL